jgi:hypothetical protein
MDSRSHAPRAGTELRRISLPVVAAVAVAGALLTGAAAAIALMGDMPHAVGLAERQALTVATPIAVGL